MMKLKIPEKEAAIRKSQEKLTDPLRSFPDMKDKAPSTINNFLTYKSSLKIHMISYVVAALTAPLNMSSTEEHIRAQLLSTKSLPVSTGWISNFLASISQNQQRAPPSALAQTALFRILATDFTKTLSTSTPSTLLPRDISDPSIKERRISGPVPVQVLDIEDIGCSMWSQVEKIEQVERGETIRGREIVRNVNVDDADNNNTSRSIANTASNGPHRLILQDAAGTRVVALEYNDINGISIEKLSIGAKLVLKDTIVARGMALLTPETVTLLGGKYESWDTKWRQKRKEVLLSKIETLYAGQNGAAANEDAMEE